MLSFPPVQFCGFQYFKSGDKTVVYTAATMKQLWQDRINITALAVANGRKVFMALSPHPDSSNPTEDFALACFMDDAEGDDATAAEEYIEESPDEDRNKPGLPFLLPWEISLIRSQATESRSLVSEIERFLGDQ